MAAAGLTAVGVVKTMIQRYEVVGGLNHANPRRPPAALAAPVIAQLLPHAPGHDHGDMLLYRCGRTSWARCRGTQRQWHGRSET